MAIIKINNNAIDLDAAEIPNLDAAKITTGQFADARFPAILPAVDGSNLTGISTSLIKLDALTASATATYALTKNSGTAVSPSVNNCIVSLNGVIQSPTDSFTISGSNIVFSEALTAQDSIDFILALGV